MDLIQAIIEAQEKRGLSDTALASLLGIDLSVWSRIKRGERKPTVTFLKAVIARMPELSLTVIDYLREDKEGG